MAGNTIFDSAAFAAETSNEALRAFGIITYAGIVGSPKPVQTTSRGTLLSAKRAEGRGSANRGGSQNRISGFGFVGGVRKLPLSVSGRTR